MSWQKVSSSLWRNEAGSEIVKYVFAGSIYYLLYEYGYKDYSDYQTFKTLKEAKHANTRAMD